MKLIEPKVLLIGETRAVRDGVDAFLAELGAQDWISGSDSDSEALVELAGRVCYRSFKPGLNPNVTRIRTDSGDYFENIIRSGDGSVLEHGFLNFAFLNISRICAMELIRHRVGVSISQESLRYVRVTDLPIWIPPGLSDRQRELWLDGVKTAEEHYLGLCETVEWDILTMPQKKVLTSAFRRMLPDGMATHVIWGANHRTIRHVIEQRTAETAEVEIRDLFDRVAKIVTTRYPLIYQDFSSTTLADGTTTWKPALRSKV